MLLFVPSGTSATATTTDIMLRHLAQTNWSTKRFAGGADPHDAPGMLAGTVN